MGRNRLRMKFCFPILCLSRPVLARNKVGMMFFNFLNFYTFFFKFSKPGWVGMDSEQNFVFPFSAFPVPFWQEIKSEWCFLIFWIFVLFFWNYRNQVESEWTRNDFIFLILGLSRPILPRDKAGKMFFNFL